MGENAQHRVGGHAIVIGASVAGLLAARVLSGACERVTIIERDEFPAIGDGRKAVPQGRHAHVLLASGPLIEGHLRRRVLALPNVTAREHWDVLDLLASPGGERVTGVRAAERGGDGAGQFIDADLVVGAGGRGGRIPAWLEGLCYPRPEEEKLHVELMYASRRARLRPGALGEDKVVLIGARPGLPRGLALIAQENDQWMITASGYGVEHHPPTDEDGYLDFVATVAPPQVAAAIRESEPLDEIVTHGFPANQRRLYERLHRFPEGLIAIGDAIASFNPLYGQGMSVAALQAIELRCCLERGGPGLARRFMRAAGKVVDPAWEMAVGGDLGLPEVAGDRPLGLRLTNAYVERLLRVAEHDPVVAAAFNDVCDLLEAPQHVMAPRVLWRVARGSLRRAPAPAPGPSTAVAKASP